ncbi:hypothetical protein FEP93_02072 [Burkholderia multivorans]|nr:hypothetical protein [Burkholderia multivorans]
MPIVTPVRLLTSDSGSRITPSAISARLIGPVPCSSTIHANVRASRFVHIDNSRIANSTELSLRGAMASSHAIGKPTVSVTSVTTVATMNVLPNTRTYVVEPSSCA